MVKSMTGFGREERDINGRHIIVEIKTVNHRYYDFNCRITKGFSFLDEKLKTFLQNSISRGKIDMFVSIGEKTDDSVQVSVNHGLVSGYIKAFNEICEYNNLMLDDTKSKNEVFFETVSKLPEIFTISKSALDEDSIWADVKIVVECALSKLLNMRISEGMRLKSDIEQKTEKISLLIDEIEKESPETVIKYRTRLEEKIRELLENKPFDEQRVLTEVAVFADKIAVDEEIVRLRSHIEAVREIFKNEEPIGRKLDFLVQEMNRETNTIGSKAQNYSVTNMVLQIKAEIEKIREQVQNIE